MIRSDGGSKRAGALLLVIAVALVVLGAQFTGHLRRMSAPAAQPAPEPAAPQLPPGMTIPKMLEEIDRRQDPSVFSYMSSERVKMWRQKLADSTVEVSQSDRMNWRVMMVNDLINSGQTEEAARECGDIIDTVKKHAPGAWPDAGPQLLMMQAVAYLRTGEEQNCCSTNNRDSCLLPVSGRGVHTRQWGSRQAIKCYNEVLRMQPDNASARWLLNLAYMTLGEYPAKVPAKWLIPMTSFGGNGSSPRYVNIAPEMGLDFLGWAGGVACEDFDDDGLLDLMISSIRFGEQMRYYRNEGNGKFVDRTRESGLIGETGGLNFITTDYNNDGRVDVVVLRGGWFGKSGHYPLSLLRNDGNGKFTDVTLESGLLTVGPSQTAVAFDYNSDGFLDLFVGYELEADNPVPSKLFRNNGNGTFTDVTELCGIHITRKVKGVISADYMKNGRPGLYISCVEQPNVLLRNDGPAGADKSAKGAWKFTDVSLEAGVDKQHATFSCFFFDYDNDGWPDIYVGGYGGGDKSVGDVAKDYLGKPTPAEKSKLYRNNHDGTFADVSHEARLDKVSIGMGINFGDLDNDGWLDFYVGTGSPDLSVLVPNRMFRNVGGKRFDEITTSGNFGHLQKGHAISFADLNNDGRQEVYAVMGGAYEGDTAHSCLYAGPSNPNRWLKLQLTGAKSNRVAIGAEICVTVATPQGERKIYKTVGPGGSFGCNPLRQEIGLGNATAIKQVDIRWPASGTLQTLTGLEMDHAYKSTEGSPRAEPVTLRKFALPTDRGASTQVARRR